LTACYLTDLQREALQWRKREVRLTRSNRAVLTLYGVASAFIFVWVPWRGGPTIRGANTEMLGYGFVWSGPVRPAAFIEYDKRLAESNKLDDPRVGFVADRPKEPEGYSQYPYKLATSNVDYGRVLLECGALTGLLLVAWMLTYAGGKSNEPK